MSYVHCAGANLLCSRRGTDRTPRDLAVEAQTDRRMAHLFEEFGCRTAGTSFWERNTAPRKGCGKGKPATKFRTK